MIGYLSCIKKSKGMNDEECRSLAKLYLGCRMDRCVGFQPLSLGYSVDIVYRNLMAKDEFKNLGFGEDKQPVELKKDDDEKGKKGELRW